AAAEIGADDDDLGVLIGRLVEDEVLLLTVGAPAHLVEQPVLQAGGVDGLQEVLGNDHVGIDIDHRQRRGDAAERREFFHGSPAKRRNKRAFRRPVKAAVQWTLTTRVAAIMSCRPRLRSVKATMMKPIPRMMAEMNLGK